MIKKALKAFKKHDPEDIKQLKQDMGYVENIPSWKERLWCCECKEFQVKYPSLPRCKKGDFPISPIGSCNLQEQNL